MMGQDQSWALGRGTDDAVGPRREFVRRFAKRIGKLTRNMRGDHWKMTVILTARMPEAAILAGGLVFTQRRSVVDADVPQGGGLGSECRSVSAKLK
ncbi:hypothetical protein B296_00006463, partial [Ensete ventricosum]